MSPTLLYKSLSVFSRHSSEGGNPRLFVFKDNGFPITTSGMGGGSVKLTHYPGMTINDFFQEICNAIYETLHKRVKKRECSLLMKETIMRTQNGHP